jgi:hypothetical protein
LLDEGNCVEVTTLDLEHNGLSQDKRGTTRWRPLARSTFGVVKLMQSLVSIHLYSLF